MAIDVSYRDTFTTSAEDLARTNRNFIINEGVAFDGLKVTQSLTPAMTVAVATGTGYFYGSGTNANVMYEFYSDASETVTIGTAGVQARIDIICLKVDASTGVASIVAVAGTPSGSPAVPATPASHYKLAEVAVGISVTTITNANITDTRRSVFVAPTGARNQGLINGKIVPTVASNNLTVAIKTLQDTDPSATNPVGIWIGNELRWITGALSIAANAGTNWFNSGATQHAGQQMTYFVYCGFNATDGITLGFARFSHARNYSNFNTTNTNIKYARISTITNATANDEYVVIGRFEATLSATASFNWSVPTFSNVTLIQEPIYNTRWMKYTPRTGTVLEAGTKNYGTIVDDNCRFMFDGSVCHVIFDLNGTTASPAANRVAIEAPFRARNTGYAGGAWTGFVAASETTGVISGRNASAGTSGWFYTVRYDLANLADGATTIFRGTITYEMEP